MGVYLFPFISATKLHFFLGVFLHFITGADRHIYPMAIDAVAAGKVNLKGIVTDVFDFDDIQNAMDKSVTDKANIVKAVVRIVKEG